MWLRGFLATNKNTELNKGNRLNNSMKFKRRQASFSGTDNMESFKSLWHSFALHKDFSCHISLMFLNQSKCKICNKDYVNYISFKTDMNMNEKEHWRDVSAGETMLERTPTHPNSDIQ